MYYPYTRVAVEAALRAGSILREMQGRVHIEFKGEIDLVTQADRSAERAILDLVTGAYPDHAVCAEESGLRDGRTCRWYVDPLDGTTNYAHGMPFYAVSIAMAENVDDPAEGERVLVGVVYLPFTGDLYVAERGHGAYRNGVPIQTSSTDDLQRSLLITGFPYSVREGGDNNLDHFGNFLLRSQGVRRLGSAALDLAMIAQGAGDGYWENELNAWDMAAGALLVQEAGGQISDMRGQEWTPGCRQILATNGHVHDAMLATLRRGSTGMGRSEG